MLGPNRLLSHPFRPRAEDPTEDGPGDDGGSPAPSDGDGNAGESSSPSEPTSQAPPPDPTTTTPEPTSTPPPRPPPSSSSTSTTKPPSSPPRPPPTSTPTRTPTTRPGTTTPTPRPSDQPSSTPTPGGNSATSQASSDANPPPESQTSLTGDQTQSSALPLPTPNLTPGGTRSIANNFGPAPSQGSDGSDGLSTDPASLGSDSQTGETGEPESTKKSGSSKLVPILVPCLLVPIVVIALLVCLVKRSRRKHRIMVDEFTNRSMMFDGGTPLMLQRTHSYASSRCQPSQGHSVASHVDALRPVQASPTGAAYLTPPTPRSAKFRQSDDLDIKCAGRVESSASFSALYDAYDGTSETGLPYAQQQQQLQQYQAPASGPSYAPAPGPSYAPAPGPSYAPAPAPMPVPAPVTMSPTQRRNNFFNRPQFMRSSNIPPAAAAMPPQQQQQQQQEFDPNWSRNPITGAPRLELPSLDFLQHERAGQVETPSPVSAVWKSEDPFAGGLADAPPLPGPPRVSSERRAARTRSVEQRLMLALAEQAK